MTLSIYVYSLLYIYASYFWKVSANQVTISVLWLKFFEINVISEKKTKYCANDNKQNAICISHLFVKR